MFRFFALITLVTLGVFAPKTQAQNIQTKAKEIRAAMDGLLPRCGELFPDFPPPAFQSLHAHHGR